MTLLVDGMNYNKPWGVEYNFSKEIVTKSVNPHWDIISGAQSLIHMPIFDSLTADELQRAKDHFIVLDYTWESFDIGHLYYSIHMDCIKYDIPEPNVILLTANLDREISTYNNWFLTTDFKNKIATFPVATFVEINHMFKDRIGTDPDKVVPGFITFSRNPRAHRNAMNYLIIENDLNAAISQSIVEPHVLKDHLTRFNIECKSDSVFLKNYEIDRTDFDTDMPVQWTEDICTSAINYSFILVQDTILDDIGFYITEKTFKYLLFNRPIIIWGQPGVNHYLKDLGFKLYDNYFDLSFDFIKNDADRLHGLLNELKRVNSLLQSIDDPYSWIYKDKNTLQLNKQTSLDRSVNAKFVLDIHNYMKEIK